MMSQKIRQYFTLTCKTPIPKLLFLIISSIFFLNYGSHKARPTHILYQCAKLVKIERHLTSVLTCATLNM